MIFRVLLIVAAAIFGNASAAAESRIEAIDAGQLHDVLAGLRGRVVLVNFWATWCRPCLKEIPELTELAEKYDESGLTLVAVSLDDRDSIDVVVRPFLDKWFPEFRTYLSMEADMDAMVSTIDQAWNEILPTSYLLDRNGDLAQRIQGGKTGAEFEAAIVPLLD